MGAGSVSFSLEEPLPRLTSPGVGKDDLAPILPPMRKKALGGAGAGADEGADEG